MTKQWEKYREIIIAEYKGQNKPLHEVQRVMKQRYGFRASTRAYRSRFDRWGIHKYSRRKRSESPSRRESVSDGDMPSSPRQSPDMEETSSPSTTPGVADFLTRGVCVTTQGMSYRSPPCVIKADFPYAPVAPSPSSTVSHNHMFPLHQFGGNLVAFSSQNMGPYPSRPVQMYRHHPRGLPLAAPDDSGYGHGAISMAGIPAGYGYSLGFHKDHE
ncbi:hypothetical protein C8A05DRAFT_37479 [Staphylotrichum tortipilum]|uniref:Clr5 domain-containing protein n=1 Tax=Staphylotrichum tortipilum TaxID=2831512 RepID=A0AAN6MDE6_9PEZI|nr:hypothetical protein C8A05DRAFT_37479 [Staphylotrichum longicolle]